MRKYPSRVSDIPAPSKAIAAGDGSESRVTSTRGVTDNAYRLRWLMFGLAVNWIGDIAAFYVGSAIGRHKLAPTISPKKSWVGVWAGLAGAGLAGVAWWAAAGVDTGLGLLTKGPVALFFYPGNNTPG